MTMYRILGRDTGVPSLSDSAIERYAVGTVVDLTLAADVEASFISAGLIERVVSAGAVAPPGGYVTGTTRTRRAQLALTGAGFNAASTSVFTDAHQRIFLRTELPSTQWRLRIRNIGANGTPLTGAVDMTGLWLGTPVVGNDGIYTGSFTATPTQVATAFTLPADGSEYVTGWITDPALQMTGADQMLSMGWTTAAAQLAKGCGSIMYSFGAGKSADANVLTPSVNFGRDANVFFDVRIEYEFTGDNLVGIAIGDSLTEGFCNETPYCPAHWSWQHRFGQRADVAMCTSAYQGSATSAWTSTSNWVWTRWANSGLTIDFAVIFLGSNDVNGMVTASTFGANLKTIVTNLKAAGINYVYLATILPRPDLQHGFLSANTSVGATSFTVSKLIGTTNIANGDTITVGTGPTMESLLVSNVSGTTITTAAAANAHTAGDLLAGPREARRQELNRIIRRGPFATNGTFDFATEVARLDDQSYPDPLYFGIDVLHCRPEGYQRLADSINGPLVRTS